MSACFHVEGVQCDNCRTGLITGVRFDPIADRWCTPTLPGYTPSPFGERMDVERLEKIIEDLQAEVRALARRIEAREGGVL